MSHTCAPAPTHPEPGTRVQEPAASRHGPIAQLLISWSPLSVLLLAYWTAGWATGELLTDDSATNRLGIGLDRISLARIDTRLFGEVPTVWLQAHLTGSGPHWYDAAVAVVYLSHFVAIPVLTTVIWFCHRERFGRWIAATIAMSLVGMTLYLLHPASPPWMAAERGEIGRVDRISHLGWEWLHLDGVAHLVVAGQAGSNPVAALPSLHAAAALLVTIFACSLVRGPIRLALLGYPLAMALSLIYSGEHYVADVLAGWAVALVAVWLSRAPSRLLRPAAKPSPVPSPAEVLDDQPAH